MLRCRTHGVFLFAHKADLQKIRKRRVQHGPSETNFRFKKAFVILRGGKVQVRVFRHMRLNERRAAVAPAPRAPHDLCKQVECALVAAVIIAV